MLGGTSREGVRINHSALIPDSNLGAENLTGVWPLCSCCCDMARFRVGRPISSPPACDKTCSHPIRLVVVTRSWVHRVGRACWVAGSLGAVVGCGSGGRSGAADGGAAGIAQSGGPSTTGGRTDSGGTNGGDGGTATGGAENSAVAGTAGESGASTPGETAGTSGTGGAGTGGVETGGIETGGLETGAAGAMGGEAGMTASAGNGGIGGGTGRVVGGSGGEGGAGAMGGAIAWVAAEDFLVEPDQENPSHDAMGNPAVWHYLERPSSLVHDSSSDTYLSVFQVVGDTNRWQSPLRSDIHQVGRGVSGGSLFVHPANAGHVVLAWQSPMTGTVSISGELRDGDGSCGNGIDWYIDRGTTPLAEGSLVNGGTRALDDPDLTSVPVIQGDFVYLIVTAAGDHSCDTTMVDLTITAEDELDLGDGLVAYYPFDGSTEDASGNGIDAVATSPIFVADAAGATNSAIAFAATGPAVDLETVAPVDFGSGSVSVTYWFTTAATKTYMTVLGNGCGGWASGILTGLNWTPGTVLFGLGANGLADTANVVGIHTTATFNDDLWHHVAVVADREAERARIYVDGAPQTLAKFDEFGVTGGVLVAGDTALDMTGVAYDTHASEATTMIGGDTYSQFFDGTIDEVRVYDRALTAGEVAILARVE